MKKKSVCIVLLGDIGRSPRMSYHALSLAQEAHPVHFIGYSSSPLLSSANISIASMTPPPQTLLHLPRLLAYPLKVGWQMVTLTWAFFSMFFLSRFIPDVILVQNPPAIPTLPLSYLASLVFRATLLIDWHNYAFSLMALQHPPPALLSFSKWLEDTAGSKAHKHLCVTRAMADDLRSRLNIKAVTLYDRPPPFFKELTEVQKRSFLSQLMEEYGSDGRLEEVLQAVGDMRKRPGILVSSTSWTEDEDFSILLTALTEYEERSLKEPTTYPALIVFITGKGPQKEHYRRLIREAAFSAVSIHLPWLEQEDYPKLLACADLGVSLHYSSSGLDLPMKVVDMFGCGLPVAAAHFNSISELVRHEENGFVFHDPIQLAQQIQGWFKRTEERNPRHAAFREALKSFQALRWHENWLLHAQPLFT